MYANVREILSVLLVSDFDDFDRGEGVKFAGTLGLIEYSEALNSVIAPLFPSLDLERVFGEPALRRSIIQEMKDVGFKFVTIDLEGYRQGSANVLVTIGG